MKSNKHHDDNIKLEKQAQRTIYAVRFYNSFKIVKKIPGSRKRICLEVVKERKVACQRQRELRDAWLGEMLDAKLANMKWDLCGVSR